MSIYKNLWFMVVSILLSLLVISGTIRGQRSGYVSHVAFAAETGVIALGLFDVVELRYIDDNELITTIASPFDGSQTAIDENFHITALSFNPAGTQLAISYSGFDVPSYVLVANTITGEILHTFIEGDGTFSLAWHPNGNQLAAKVRYGSLGMTFSRLVVWDIITGNQAAFVDIGANANASGLDWHSNGSQILGAYISSTIVIWDTSNWARGTFILEADNIVLDAVWNMDESKIIALDYERTLYVWDSVTGELLHKLQNGLAEGNYQLSVSSDDKVAISGGLNIVIWDIGAEPTSQVIPVTNPIADIVWLNDEELLYTDNLGYHIYQTTP